MSNPITQNIRYLTGYFGLWLVLAIIQTAVLYFFFLADLYSSAIDALLFNFTLSILGLAIWPLVSFSSLEGAQLMNTVVTHIAGASVLIALLVFINYNIVAYLLVKNESYLVFIENSILWRVALATIIYVLIALNYYVIIYNQEFKTRSINESELRRSLKEAELEMLKSQLNPHFIFNSLNSISSLTITNPQKAQEMVISLSNFLRYSIKPNEKKLIELRYELEAITQFIIIEKVRFGDRLNVKIDCDNQCKGFLLPPLILQPLIENAIKFGVHETLKSEQISLTCSCINNVLEIKVENTFESEAVVPLVTSGIGLKNVATRLKTMYGAEDLLKIKKQQSLFIVSLLIPQNT